MVLDVGCYGNGLVMFVNFISLWRYRMKSEDTILKSEEMLRIPAGFVNIKGTLKKQAEISFKAGQEDVLLESKMGTLTVSSLVNRGRKEVVDWIEKNNILNGVVVQNYGKWQAKLKEWGLE